MGQRRRLSSKSPTNSMSVCDSQPNNANWNERNRQRTNLGIWMCGSRVQILCVYAFASTPVCDGDEGLLRRTMAKRASTTASADMWCGASQETLRRYVCSAVHAAQYSHTHSRLMAMNVSVAVCARHAVRSSYALNRVATKCHFHLHWIFQLVRCGSFPKNPTVNCIQIW